MISAKKVKHSFKEKYIGVSQANHPVIDQQGQHDQKNLFQLLAQLQVALVAAEPVEAGLFELQQWVLIVIRCWPFQVLVAEPNHHNDQEL